MDDRNIDGDISRYVDDLFDKLVDKGWTDEQIAKGLRSWDLEDAWADYSDQNEEGRA